MKIMEQEPQLIFNEYKICSKCDKFVHKNKFYKRGDSLRSFCKKCTSDYEKIYHSKKKAKINKRHRIVYEANKLEVSRKRKEKYRQDPRVKILWRAKQRAKQYNIPFDLTVDDIEIPEKCPILGIEIIIGKGCGREHSPSLDRKIPKLGYVKENIEIISNRANRIKNDGTAKEHRLIAEHMDKKV